MLVKKEIYFSYKIESYHQSKEKEIEYIMEIFSNASICVILFMPPNAMKIWHHVRFHI